MTRSGPATDHWSVTARTQGGVQSAVASLPSIEMALLGIPEGFTAGEIQSWLRDLAGVAIETSRTDERTRPIPQLLHHVLTGLLFSQTELWSHTGQALPCAAVFVETLQGIAFGWVGRARVVILVNGEPYEPQWVIVRDEMGQEAMSAMLPAESHAMLTLEYWPHGESGQQAPASVDAEVGQSFASRANLRTVPAASALPSSSLSAATPRPVASPMPATPAPGSGAVAPPEATPAPVAPVASAPVANAPAASAPAAPSSPSASGTPAPASPQELTTGQPGLAPDPSRPLSLDEPDETQSLPSTFHASSSTFAMPALPGGARPAETSPGGVPRPETELTRGHAALEPGGEHAPAHPVGRWLTRLMGFAKQVMPAHEAGTSASAPPPLPRRAPSPTPPALAPVAPSAPARPPVLSSPAAVAFAPPPIATTPSQGPAPVAPVLSAPGAPAPAVPAAAAPRDIHEPHALPSSAEPAPGVTPATTPAFITPSSVAPAEGTPHATATPSAKPAGKGGLLAVGLSDILGSRASVAPARPVAAPVEGLTAVSAPSGPVTPDERSLVTPESLTPGQAPYPMLQVTPPPPAPAPRGPIQIEREPVGADVEFAIPKLPPREAPRPFKVPVPTAADTVKPPVPAPSVRPAAPAANPAVGAAASATPAPTVAPRPPVAAVPVTPPLPSAPAAAAAPARPVVMPPAPVPPLAAGTPKPKLVPPVVPEPPADFLAEFAASLGADIKVDAPPPPAPTSRPAPQLPSVKRAVANVSPAAPATPPFIGLAPLSPAAPAPPPAAAAPPPVLSTPSEAEPISVSQSELPLILRELPLPAQEAPPENEVPDGMLVATPMSGTRARRGTWPAIEDEPRTRPLWRNPWLIGAFVALLFGVGWIVGHSQAPDNDIHATPMSRMLRAVGLAGARFTATVDSDPPGAIISVDGKETGRRTPATLELVPGSHQISLSMADLGQVDVEVKGSRGQKLKVSEALHGSLEVTALDKSLPVKVSLDGEPMGFLPLTVDKLPPGLHEVQFSGPNMQPWAQNVSVPIRGVASVKARPMMSPATGVLQVQAILNDEGGSTPLSGAAVFVDGEPRGTTPEQLELPRGPHSIKVTYRGTAAPVQVIDLPGGNKRFAQFQFGLDSDLPPLKLKGDFSSLPAKKPTVVEATLDGLDWHDVREAWLHVRTGEGLWRRYQVTIEEGPRGTLLSAPFPQGVSDANGRVTWYMSAATTQGDDFYTEMQRSTR